MKINKQMGLKLLVVALPIIVVGIIFYYFQDIESKTIKEDVYQYVMSNKYEYNDGVKLSKGEENVSIEYKGETFDADISPLYYPDGRKITLLNTMAFVRPAKNCQSYKVNYFTDVAMDGPNIKIGKSKEKVENGFLYDGNDLYIFLEPVTLKIADTSVQLPTFAYIIVNYNQIVTYFDPANSIYKQLETGAVEVTATTRMGYTVDLQNDVVISNDSQNIMMVDPSLLDIFK